MRNHTKRRSTTQRGVYQVLHDDGTCSYIATWRTTRPLSITDPLTTARRRAEARASTFEEACRLQDEGEAAERERRPVQSLAERLGERIMAAKWFEYWVRR